MPRARRGIDTAEELAKKLRDQLGPDRVLLTPAEIGRFPYRFHWPPLPGAQPAAVPLGEPAAVIRPTSTADVALTLRAASAAAVAVVPYGAGTGVMGAARPTAGSLVLDLGAMGRILAIDPDDRVARVEPGVVLADLARAAEERGLLFAHDPWSQPVATVGGAVATNGVGYLAAGYGPMGAQVRALEVALADGAIVSWDDAAKAAGPALWTTFVGSEGTLGVMTRVDVQLFPRPAERAFRAFRFPAFPEGFAAIREVLGQGLRPAMIDYEETDEPGLPLGVPADLYLAFDGPPEVVAAAAGLATGLCRHYDGADRGEAIARAFWERRHEVAEWFVQRPPASWRRPGPPHPQVYVNLAVPTGRLLDYCARVISLAGEAGVAAGSFGIWGRPELLSFTLEAKPESLDALPGAVDRALRLARDEGGSIEYCHGVGVRLAHLYSEETGGTYAFFRRIKAALDPQGILNPGKLLM